jgi:alcohol dehydrogenase YqhD (iron-dependent ADH family)
MGWNRAMMEQTLEAAYQAEGGPDFAIFVPESDMPAVLMQLEHLKKKGRLTSFNRRLAQTQDGRNDKVYVYGYTPAE